MQYAGRKIPKSPETLIPESVKEKMQFCTNSDRFLPSKTPDRHLHLRVRAVQHRSCTRVTAPRRRQLPTEKARGRTRSRGRDGGFDAGLRASRRRRRRKAGTTSAAPHLLAATKEDDAGSRVRRRSVRDLVKMEQGECAVALSLSGVDGSGEKVRRGLGFADRPPRFDRPPSAVVCWISSNGHDRCGQIDGQEVPFWADFGTGLRPMLGQSSKLTGMT